MPSFHTPPHRTELLLSSRLPRGQLIERPYAHLGAETAGLDRDMFSLIWGPTLAAVSVVLDHSSDPLVVRQALEGLKLVAKMAAYHQVDQVRRVELCNGVKRCRTWYSPLHALHACSYDESSSMVETSIVETW